MQYNTHIATVSNRLSLAIWGTSGHALVVADIIRSVGEYEIVGFLDDVHPERQGAPFCGSLVLGGREQLEQLRAGGVEYLIFGFGDCGAKLILAKVARAQGFRFATAIHPRAVIAQDVPVGSGTVICAGAVVNPGAQLGEHVIVNTCASVDHQCSVEDGAHIGPGARLGGMVMVGQAAWVGIGAIVKDRVSIGAGSIIGAGSVVLQDIPAGVVAYGVPAKVIREI